MTSVLGGMKQLNLNFYSSSSGGTKVINAVLEHTKGSLQTLKLTDSEPPTEPGLWNPRNFRNFQVSRHLCVTDVLLFDPAIYDQDVPGQRLQLRRQIEMGAPLSAPKLDYVDPPYSLPFTIETLRVGPQARHSGPRLGETNTVHHQLCVLVKLKAASQFSDLRVICVALLTRYNFDGSILRELQQLCDAKSITLHSAGFGGCELCNDAPGTVFESLPDGFSQND